MLKTRRHKTAAYAIIGALLGAGVTAVASAFGSIAFAPQSAQRGPKPPIGFITLNKHNCTYGIGATEDELHIIVTGDAEKCYALIRLDGYPLPRGRRAALR